MSALPPEMKPCRPELRDLACFGNVVDGASLLSASFEPCGRLVTLRCPRCAVHRCAECCFLGRYCPVCPLTEPYAYAGNLLDLATEGEA